MSESSQAPTLADRALDTVAWGYDICKGESATGIRRNNAEKGLAVAQNRAAKQTMPEVREFLRSGTERNRSEVVRNKIQSEAADGIQRSFENIDESVKATSEGLIDLAKNADHALHGMAKNLDTHGASIAQSAEASADALRSVSKDVNGLHVMSKSLLDRVDYYGNFAQMATLDIIIQLHKISGSLDRIANGVEQIDKALRDGNRLTAQGSRGEYGFATTVHRYIRQRVYETEHQGGRENHRFFIYHPDNDWYPAFYDLVREEPLPETFCAKSDNLDKICQMMLSYRETLAQQSPEGKSIVFHLLIPGWYHVKVEAPLYFPDELQPFRVEGMKSCGGPYFIFNLPDAPESLLGGVGNELDPKGHNRAAYIAGAATLTGTFVTSSLSVLAVGVALAPMSAVGALLYLPFMATPHALTFTVGGPAAEAVANTMAEDGSRILGSTRRKPNRQI
ncbi:uncharacterized protein DNG_09657 [Cephalotrichum gorgonifer]|uniref:Uncharacterized protein n=1 Tax=Cephalotrichum gorgonifer TaxID=2041049 RepID=A0AAE8N7Y8_9PEZI|nr:uncharacterized protein DNG_09657 [Cephalotrichum gorgonifer]